MAAVALAIAGLAGGCSAPAATPSQDPLAAIVVTPSVSDSSLVATGAFADFGVSGGGARQVRVRIVDKMNFGLRIATTRELALAEPPVLCLVGPYSAPDDAGLESPCWGDPDLSSELQAELGQDSAGHYLLTPDQPINLAVQLSRGSQRCDYPPGEWQVELRLNPLSGGAASGARYLPDTPFDVPITQTGPLKLLPTTETRYCGLATAIVQQQGEPEVISP
jgi:hypothetical protein